MLVFRYQDITNEYQISFRERLGLLEAKKVGASRSGSQLVIPTNISPNGEILNGGANKKWLGDSSFTQISADALMPSTQVLPKPQGNTEFLSMRTVYKELTNNVKASLTGKIGRRHYA